MSKATLTYLALQSVGFDVQCKRVRVFEEPPNMAEVKERQKTARAYVVPDRRVWQEVVSRYYYDEPTGALVVQIPDVLKSLRFVRREPPQASQVSTVTHDHECVTGVTDATLQTTQETEASE